MSKEPALRSMNVFKFTEDLARWRAGLNSSTYVRRTKSSPKSEGLTKAMSQVVKEYSTPRPGTQ